MENFAKELAWIETQGPRMIERVKAWSAINSGSHNQDGLAKMAALIAGEFTALGADLEIHQTAPGKRVNERGEVFEVSFGPVYHFTKRAGANRTVLLTGHMDTVFPKAASCQTPKRLDDNTLNGPGVADM